MQKSYSIFNALGAIVGNFAIISGCVVTESTATNGVVYINGEVLEFRGGIVQEHVIIVQTAQLREFEDANSRDVIYTRWATFGTGTTQWSWTDFKRGIETKFIPEALDFKEDKTTVAALLERIEALEAVTTVNVPSGLIAIWGQAANLIPDGWTEYTPLRGRTAVGYNSSIAEFDVLGDFGGAANKTLSIIEIPAHTHSIKATGIAAAGGGGYLPSSGGSLITNTESIGGGQAFSIMNPYRVVLYIQKT